MRWSMALRKPLLSDSYSFLFGLLWTHSLWRCFRLDFTIRKLRPPCFHSGKATCGTRLNCAIANSLLSRSRPYWWILVHPSYLRCSILLFRVTILTLLLAGGESPLWVDESAWLYFSDKGCPMICAMAFPVRRWFKEHQAGAMRIAHLLVGLLEVSTTSICFLIPICFHIPYSAIPFPLFDSHSLTGPLCKDLFLLISWS